LARVGRFIPGTKTQRISAGQARSTLNLARKPDSSPPPSDSHKYRQNGKQPYYSVRRVSGCNTGPIFNSTEAISHRPTACPDRIAHFAAHEPGRVDKCSDFTPIISFSNDAVGCCVPQTCRTKETTRRNEQLADTAVNPIDFSFAPPKITLAMRSTTTKRIRQLQRNRHGAQHNKPPLNIY
jgi:hypothetical protein